MKKAFKKIPKLYIILGLIFFTFIITIAVPTLSRFYSGINNEMGLTIWDGSIATSYTSGTGSKSDPYIISNASEFAYFGENLNTMDYDGAYFRLDGDIILNEGFFIYENNLIKYVVNDVEYFVKKYTTEVYLDKEMTQLSDIVINEFAFMDDFKGHLDGNFFSIYGLYIENDMNDELALFNTLSGSLSNVYIQNMFIQGGFNTAGIAVNANDLALKNIYTSGYVIANEKLDEANSISFDDVHFTTTDYGYSFNLDKNGINDNVVSSSLSGNYLVSDTTDLNYELLINNLPVELGEFKVDLGTTPLSDVVISAGIDTTPRNVSLINLKYEVVYSLSNSSGIINNASNVTMDGIVNEVNVYNDYISSGLINNVNGSLEVINSYNKGSIYGYIDSSGLINSINSSNVSINKTYNIGSLYGVNNYGLINTVGIYDNVSVNNSFNTFNASNFGLINNTVLNNVYNKNLDSNLNVLLLDSLYTNEFFKSLGFGDFNENSKVNGNVWVFNESLLPELFFIDEMNLIDLRTGNDYWNNYTYVLGNTYYNKAISLAVTSSAYIYTLDTVEYYVKNDDIPLSIDELDLLTWESYDKPIVIDGEGKYVVYVKLTDFNGEYRYINSDIINIDTVAPEGSISFDDNVWDSYRSDVSELKLIYNNTITITSADADSGVGDVNYLVSKTAMSEDELNNLNEANWSDYDSEFSLEPTGGNILYAQILDNSGNATYINTDIITFDGYNMASLKVGRNNMFESVDTINISSKSSIVANYVYNIPYYDEPEINHYVMLNQALPSGTLITLRDSINYRVYEYEVVEGNTSTMIPFTDFVEVGSINSNFVESDYNDGTYIRENFSVTLNFVSADFSSNIINLQMWMEVRNNSLLTVRPTVESTITPVNVYMNSDASLFLNSNVSSLEFKYSHDSITTLDLNTGVTYASIGGVPIYDTFIEEQSIVVQFKVFDTFGNLLDKSHLNNILLKIDDKKYYPDSSGVFTVSLDTSIQEINKQLEIYAYKGDTFLYTGTYSLEMSSFISYNEVPTDYLITKSIPVVVDPSVDATNTTFKGEMISDPIISKELENALVDFKITASGFDNPNVRISLYKKNTYDAFDQTYSLVDLNTFITSPLEVTEVLNVYKVPTGEFSINLNTSLLDLQSYKFVMDAYDGDVLIKSMESYFIVK